MFAFPSIFEWLDRLGFLRGLPAAYLVLLAALVIVIIWDWRLAIVAMVIHYLGAALLFVDVLDPRLAMIKLLVGWFICLMLAMAARQAAWGRLPEDVTPEESVQQHFERQVGFGPYLLPSGTPFRVFLALLVTLVVLALSNQPGYRLPVVPEHVNLAILALVGLGILGASLTSEPLKVGLSLLLFLTGFELFYSSVEQSVAMLGMLAVVDLALAVTIAYLVQARHGLAALLLAKDENDLV